MNRFAPALRRLAGELDLPAGVRAAILLELAADLEAVYEHHLGRGAGEAEAARRAEEMVLGSPDLARRLGRVHRNAWQTWPHRVAAPGGVDVLLLLAAVLPMVAVSAAVGVRGAAVSAGPFIWPLLAAGAVLALVTSVEAGRLLGGLPARPRTLTALPVIAFTAFALGLLAFALDARAMATAFAAGVTDPAAMVAQVERFGRGGAVFLVGLHLAGAGVLSWFILVQRAAVRAVREVDAMLAPDGSPTVAARSTNVLPLRRRRQT